MQECMVKYICYKLQSFSMMTLKYLMRFTLGEQQQCKCKRAALFNSVVYIKDSTCLAAATDSIFFSVRIDGK